MNIWYKLPRPFTVLAPMDDVTDVVFRELIAEVAPPDLFFTEFANADGLQSPGREAVEMKIKKGELDKPLIAQVWGKNPKSYYEAARELAERGFDGIDINFGCPVPAVTKNGCCSAMMNDRPLAAELIAATKEGSGSLPVSVKTRIGYDSINTEEWCGWLLEQGIDALIVHGRTVAEQSRVPARWDEIAQVVSLRNLHAPHTVIVGNGDVKHRVEAELLAQETGVDGVMIGRGIFQDPWCFSAEKISRDMRRQRYELLSTHVERFVDTWGDDKPFNVMKKFFKMYISGWDGAASERAELMECNTADEFRVVLGKLLKTV